MLGDSSGHVVVDRFCFAVVIRNQPEPGLCFTRPSPPVGRDLAVRELDEGAQDVTGIPGVMNIRAQRVVKAGERRSFISDDCRMCHT